ncbi:unnamed protein product, partial [Cladocopium goreaui]
MEPVALAEPVARVGLDLNQDGQAVYVEGVDRNRDGIPDILQATSYGQPRAQAIQMAEPSGVQASPRSSAPTMAEPALAGETMPIPLRMPGPGPPPVRSAMPQPLSYGGTATFQAAAPLIQEVVREVPVRKRELHTIYREKPQVEYVEKTVDVPKVEVQERLVEVPQVLLHEPGSLE